MNPFASSIKEALGLFQAVIVCGLALGIPLVLALLLIRERTGAITHSQRVGRR